MKSYIVLLVFINFWCSGVFANHTGPSVGKCDEYADIPEPPCCGAVMDLGDRLTLDHFISVSNEEVPYFVTVAGGIGTLISARWVLTCGHCLADGSQPVRITVSANGLKIEADFWMHHPLYRVPGAVKNQVFDIALVRMIEPFPISKVSQPICLPTSSKFGSLDFSDKYVTTVGWHKGEVQGQKTNKGIAIVPVLSQKRCDEWRSLVRLCTPLSKSIAASGSAMSTVANYNPLGLEARYVIGVGNVFNSRTSFQFRYTRIDAVTEWIKAVINANKE